VSDTPRTDAARPPYSALQEFVLSEFARTLERELNAAQERIKRLEAVTNDPHALWVNWLRGSVTLPVGTGDVSEYQDRIKRLEEALDTLTLVVGLTPIRGNLAALQEAMDQSRSVLKAKEAKP
jgi:hypothetical protein